MQTLGNLSSLFFSSCILYLNEWAKTADQVWNLEVILGSLFFFTFLSSTYPPYHLTRSNWPSNISWISYISIRTDLPYSAFICLIFSSQVNFSSLGLISVSRLVPSSMGFPGSPVGKESTYNAGDWGSIPGSGRSLGEGNGKPLQYACLENPMDRGAWWAVAKRWTWLSN